MTDSPLPTAVRGLIRVARLVEAAAGDLSIADFRVLSIIARGEDSPSQVATRLLLSKPTISSTLDSLRKRGLIERSTVPDDARAVTLSLSEEGADLLERAERRMSRQLELLCAHTPDADQIVASLATLEGAVEDIVTDRLARAANAPKPG
ncbi:MAG: MarR family winged helix-turn-helix transcriptional regulator [Cellulomonas sp.]